MHLRVAAIFAIAAAIAACTNVSAPGGPTASPAGSITVPSAPPVSVPSVSVPSLDIPSLDIPSGLPSVPTGAQACALVTAAELQTIFGVSATTVTDTDGGCTITPTGEMFPVVLRYGQNETIDAAKMIVENGEDLVVGGNRAFYGELMGGILYIEKNGRTLVLQSPLNTELKDAMIRIGELASARF